MHHSQCICASPSKTQLVYHMPRIKPNAILFITWRRKCFASPPMRACISFQDSTCVPFATHHAQCVSAHRPLPSITLCTICHASRPMRFSGASPSQRHLVYPMPHISPNAIPFSTLRSICHASPLMHVCVFFQESTRVPYATHHARCVSVHRLLPCITLCAICHASHPMQFRKTPCVPYATHHPQYVSVRRPLTSIIVYHLPHSMPNAIPCIT